MSRRVQIEMSGEEVIRFVNDERTVTCATIGPRGWPHLMPLWYVVREGPEIWAWTYAASQKVVNLERDPRATLQVQAGETYEQLRGVMFECEAIILRETPVVEALGVEIFKRYAPGSGQLPADVRRIGAKQAPKRVALQFRERRRASWDHRKLGGVY